MDSAFNWKSRDMAHRQKRLPSFVDLPAEVRTMIYQYLMPDIYSGDCAFTIFTRPGRRNRATWDLDSGRKPFEQLAVAAALMRSCSVLRRDLMFRVYSKAKLIARDIQDPSATVPTLGFSKLARSLISWIAIDNRHIVTKVGRSLVADMIKEYPTLDYFEIHGVSYPNNTILNGTPWDPRALVALQALRGACDILTEYYWEPFEHRTVVYFLPGIAPDSYPGLRHLDVDGELGRWFEAMRWRKVRGDDSTSNLMRSAYENFPKDVPEDLLEQFPRIGGWDTVEKHMENWQDWDPESGPN